MKYKFSPIQKITIAAMLVVLDTFFIALSKILPLRDIGILYVRINAGPAIVIYASLLLGPLYGGIVGALGDLLAMLIAPIGTYNPFITIINILYGVIPWLLMLLTRHFRTKLKMPILVGLLLLLLVGGTAGVMYGTDLFNYGDQTVWVKPVILAAVVISALITGIGIYYINKKYQKNILEMPNLPSPCEIGIICIFVEVLLGVFANSLAILFYFNVLAGNTSAMRTFGVIVPFYLSTCCFEILIEVSLVTWMCYFSHRYFKRFQKSDNGE